MTRSSPDSRKSNHLTLAVVAIAFAMFMVYLLRYVLLPFVVAGALAYVAMPAVRAAYERLRWPRWVGAMAVFVAYSLVFMLIGLAIVKIAVPQLTAVMHDLPRTLHRFFSTLFGGDQMSLLGMSLDAGELSRKLSGWLPGGASPDPRGLLDVVGFGVAAVMGAILTLVLLLYFLIESARLSRGAIWLTPPSQRDRVLNIARKAGPLLYRYVVGIFVIVFYTIAVTWLFARGWLGLPHAELLAIAVGLLEMIPVAGPALSVMMIALIAIEQLTFGMIVGVAIFATFLRVTIDQFIGPIVLGKATDLPPPLIIFAFLAGGAIYGALGVLIAIPVMAVGKITVEEFRASGEPMVNSRESKIRQRDRA